MSTFYKCQIFAASKDSRNTTVKLVNPKFKDNTVWLNLRNGDKPDFGAQKVVAEILRALVGSGSHRVISIHHEEIQRDEKGALSVAMTAENLKSRWELVMNAGPSEDESKARELFAEELASIKQSDTDNELPF
jgi:hypothetical protein